MRIFSITLLSLFMACAACGTEQDASETQPQNSSENTDNPAGESDTTNPADSETTNDPSTDPEGGTDTNTDNLDPSNMGSVPTSCGSESQGLEPVDCTMHGDANAQCVFSNHCMCNVEDGFECDSKPEDRTFEECNPGSTCIPIVD